MRRMTSVPVRPMMLELAYSFWLMWRSLRIVRVSSGGKAYLLSVRFDRGNHFSEQSSECKQGDIP